MDAAKETGRSLASKFQHRFMYALIKWGGRTLAYGFLYIVVLVYTLWPRVAARSRAYIVRRFKPQNKWQFFKHTYLLNLTFGRTLIDRAALGILGTEHTQATQQQYRVCEELLKKGKGVLLLTAHAGCWQMAVNLMGFLHTPLHVLYYHNPQDNDKSVSAHRHGAAPFHVINPLGPAGGMLEMLPALQAGHAVCAMADRVFGNEENSVEVSFFGEPVRVPYSFYRVAAVTGAPVAVFFIPWKGKGKLGVCGPRVIEVPDLGPQKENYTPYAQQFMDALEEFCIQYPYQLFNYFNMWESASCKTSSTKSNN